jgi:outer membrane receptor protein involved in Fe transport
MLNLNLRDLSDINVTIIQASHAVLCTPLSDRRALSARTIGRIACLLLVCLLDIDAAAQYIMQGRVVDAANKEALVGAVIRLGTGGATADLDGNFEFNYTPNGNDTIYINHISYEGARIPLAQWPTYQGTVALRMLPAMWNVVVVSAGKFEQKIGEVTVSMEVLSEDLVRDKNAITADEAVQQAPGVHIIDGEPQIRSGSGYSFGAGSRVQILVDDLPVLSGDAGRPSWGSLPIENLSQIEIIKGASSVLYGSSALSGVINMRTAYPADTARTVFTLFHGMYSDPEEDSAKYWSGTPMRSGLSFLHSQKFGAWDVVLGGSYLGDDGHLGPIKEEGQSFEKGYNPFTADRYYATSRGRLNANIRRRSKRVEGLSYGINTNWGMSNSLATLLWENVNDGLYSAYDGSATRTKQLIGTVDPFIQYFNSKGGKHTLRTRWQSLDNDNDNDQGNFSDVYYGEYQYQQNWDSLGLTHFTTTVGVVRIHTDARGQLFSGGNTNGRNQADNTSAYLQLDKKFGKRLHASAGVRYEQFAINEETSSKPVFRAGINYQLAKATYIRSSYGQGYRFPSIAEKFIVTGVGAINIFSNPELRPETSSNVEIGIKQGFKLGSFMGYLDLAAFEQQFDQFVEFTFGQWTKPVFAPGVPLQESLQKSFGFKSVNTGQARIRGAEITIMGEGKWKKMKVQALAGYTYTLPISLTPNYAYGENQGSPPTDINYLNTSSDTTNHLLKYRMQHLVRADIGVQASKWNAGVSMRYNSHMQNIDNAFQELEDMIPALFNPGINTWRQEHTDGDYVIDVRVGYTFLAKHRVALVINNLLNRTYAIRPLAIEEPRVSVLQYTLSF